MAKKTTFGRAATRPAQCIEKHVADSLQDVGKNSDNASYFHQLRPGSVFCEIPLLRLITLRRPVCECVFLTHNNNSNEIPKCHHTQPLLASFHLFAWHENNIHSVFVAVQYKRLVVESCGQKTVNCRSCSTEVVSSSFFWSHWVQFVYCTSVDCMRSF